MTPCVVLMARAARRISTHASGSILPVRRPWWTRVGLFIQASVDKKVGTVALVQIHLYECIVLYKESNKSSVESQKGVNGVQRCSIENQKGAIALQSL